MPIIGDAAVAVDADTSPFDRNLKSGVEKSATGVGSIIKGILGAAVVTQGARMASDLVKASIGEAREAQKVAAQTNQVIQTTGGIAGVSAKQVDQLANAISRKTGIDDEQIASAENLLLTFTNVRNGVGKNNDIFNQSTKVVADMSKALGQDFKSSAIQVGKALNDPIKGVTALQRVGVSFTAAQKDQIAALVNSGKAMDAQKLILKELNTEFGGSAEATATAGEKLGVTFKNIEESIGTKLLPIIDTAANFLADKLPGALDAAGRAFRPIVNIVTQVVGGIRSALSGQIITDKQLGGFNKLFVVARQVTQGVKAFFEAFKGGGVTSDGFVGNMEKIGVKVREIYEHVLKPLGAFISTHLKPIIIGLGVAFLAITSPITLAVAAFTLAYIKIKPFRELINAIVTDVIGAVGGLVEFVQTNMPKFTEAFEHVAAAVLAVFNQFKGTIGPLIEGIVNTIVEIIQRVVDIVKNVVLFVTNIINGDFGTAFGNLKAIVGDAIGVVLSLLRNIVPALAGLAVGVFSAMAKVGKAILEGIGDGIGKAVGFVADFAKGVGNAIVSFLNKQVVDRINDAIPDTINLPRPLPDINLPNNPIPHIPRLARGGITNAPVFFGGDNPSHQEAVFPLDSPQALALLRKALAPANDRAPVTFGDINIYEVQGDKEATAFAAMSRVAAALNR